MVDKVKKILELIPYYDFAGPSQDGIMIEFYNRSGDYCMIEFYDDGDIVFLIRSPSEIESWDLTEDNYYEFIKSKL